MKEPNLNRRVQFQVQTSSQDEFGQEQQTWTTVYSCWAAIEQQQSQHLYSTAEFMSKTVWRITIRWTSSQVFEPQMRIVYTQQKQAQTFGEGQYGVGPLDSIVHTYEIQAIDNPGQANHYL